ncbi:hypothetical protein BRD56_11285 [Thermoplasmatales archaeon SW_10_69_26]|nr:MAG: hypothetical protein BRD56_11285 [Thermoplasmatales archaeon SW_10_69_26]
MHRRLVLTVVLLLAGVAAPVAAEQGARSCQVDVGAPFLLLDSGERASQRVTVGGCQLVHDLDEASVLTEAEPGDWPVTPLSQDCRIQVDDDGDGSGLTTVERGDEVRQGADLWAKCEAGDRLDNRIELAPT